MLILYKKKEFKRYTFNNYWWDMVPFVVVGIVVITTSYQYLKKTDFTHF